MTPQEIAQNERAIFRHIFWYRARRRLAHTVRTLLWFLALLGTALSAWSWW